MSAPLSRTLAVSLAAVLIAAPGGVLAGEFDLDSDDWYGLSGFASIAEQRDVVMERVDRLDWEEVEADDVVVVIYPGDELDVDGISAFLVGGGRLLLADDFGESEPLLDRLSIRRTEPAVEQLPHEQFVDDHRGWPLFEIDGRHPLLMEVEQLVANYPAVLHNVGGPVVSYDEQGGLVYDMELGAGRAVVVADPGVLINATLLAADNRQFAGNLWSYLCAGVEECRAWILVEDVAFTGSADHFTEPPPGELAERIEQFNQRLQEVFQQLAASPLLFLLALFVALGAIAYLLTVFSWRRSTWLSAYIERRRRSASRPVTEFDWNVERFTDPEGRINYTLPAAILKESFEELFLEQFDLWPSRSDERPSIAALAQRFEQRYLRAVSATTRRKRRREVEQLLADLTTVPTRDRIFLESDEFISARQLERLYRRILRVLDWMGLRETYERRTRGIDGRTFRTG